MDMKRIAIITGTLSIGIIVGTLGLYNVNADNATPGSIDDPVVTKSYVDRLLGGGSDAKRELEQMMEAFRKEVANSSGATAEVVTVKPGEVLFAAPGAQVVLRAGAGVAYSSDTSGISDVTSGEDIKNGKPVKNNHLLLFPREGRGVMPDPARNVNLTVMITGGYQIAALPNNEQ